MKIRSLGKICYGLLKARVFKLKSPLAVSWALTYRCDEQCLYCRLNHEVLEELSTREALEILEQLHRARVWGVVFTGGEPLLREDIGLILDRAAALGLRVVLNTNGKRVPDAISKIKKIFLLKISLDGPEEIHDSIRGKGNFQKVVTAIKTARQAGIAVELNTVISSLNAAFIPEVIRIAKGYRIQVSFQPASLLLLGGKGPNPIATPDKAYQKAIDYLIAHKREGGEVIATSLATLEHLKLWPQKNRINCFAGSLSCRIEPDGLLLACGWTPILILKRSDGIDLRKHSFEKALQMLRQPSCDGCWSSACVDFNLLGSWNFRSAYELFKKWKRLL